jgi:hypothetical protein
MNGDRRNTPADHARTLRRRRGARTINQWSCEVAIEAEARQTCEGPVSVPAVAWTKELPK